MNRDQIITFWGIMILLYLMATGRLSSVYKALFVSSGTTGK